MFGFFVAISGMALFTYCLVLLVLGMAEKIAVPDERFMRIVVGLFCGLALFGVGIGL